MGALAIFFSNQLTVKYLDERKEWLLMLAAERKEWHAQLEKLTDRYDARMTTAIATMEAMKAEMHALRGRLQEFMTSMENRLIAIENKMRGVGND